MVVKVVLLYFNIISLFSHCYFTWWPKGYCSIAEIGKTYINFIYGINLDIKQIDQCLNMKSGSNLIICLTMMMIR